MQPNYIPQGPAFELDWSDRKAIQKLYGKAVLGKMILGADRDTGGPQSIRGPHALLTGRLAPKGHQMVQSDVTQEEQLPSGSGMSILS